MEQELKHIGKQKQETKNALCQLCLDEDKKEKVMTYVGGFIAHAHPSCVEIGVEAVELYEQFILFHYKILPEILKKKALEK